MISHFNKPWLTQMSQYEAQVTLGSMKACQEEMEQAMKCGDLQALAQVVEGMKDGWHLGLVFSRTWRKMHFTGCIRAAHGAETIDLNAFGPFFTQDLPLSSERNLQQRPGSMRSFQKGRELGTTTWPLVSRRLWRQMQIRRVAALQTLLAVHLLSQGVKE